MISMGYFSVPPSKQAGRTVFVTPPRKDSIDREIEIEMAGSSLKKGGNVNADSEMQDCVFKMHVTYMLK